MSDEVGKGRLQTLGDCPSADPPSLPGVAPSVDRRMSEV